LSREVNIRVLFLATISLYWVERLYHYYIVLQDYAQRGMHLTHTDLYVAVENWLLLCAVMFTATAVLLITVTTSKTTKDT